MPATAHATTNTQTAAPIELAPGGHVKCVFVPDAKPPEDPKKCGYEIIAQPPAAKGVLAYLVGPGANVILKGIDTNHATFTQEGENMRITTADGGEILLLDFVTSAKQEACTSITTDAGTMAGGKLLAGLEKVESVDDVEPAAGPASVVRAPAPPVSNGGFTPPTIDGNQFGFGDKVLSSVIGPFAIPFGRDSIEYKEFPFELGKGGTPSKAPVNQPPDAVNDVATTRCEHPVNIRVLANDSDADGDTLTLAGIVSAPAHGVVVINSDGTITYTPEAGFTGEDFFQYRVEDGQGGFDVAQVKVVTINNAPDAVNDTRSTAFNTPVTIAALANDSDPDGDHVSITRYTNPSNGTVVQNTDGTFTYTPNAGFSGTDTFTYTISDGKAYDTATVTITVGNPPPPPPPPNTTDANNDTATTHCGNAVTVRVLANDTDIEGDTTRITGNTQGSHGTVTVNPDGTVTYTPDIGFVGTDTFTYTVTDARGAIDTATVTINVTNAAPDAVDDARSTAFNTPITVNVLANDIDPDHDGLAVDRVVSGPANGTAVLNADGTITYTPNAGFSGTDTFTYMIDDSCGAHDVATVTITVAAPPNDTDARNDTANTRCDHPVTIAVLANDVDAQGDTQRITGITNGANGTVTINANGTVTYTPVAGFSGTDTFTYTITDAHGAKDTATVTVYVAGNNGPDAVNDTRSTAFNTPVTITALANDSDPDGDHVSITRHTNPSNGTVVQNTDGTFTYTPNAGFSGTDTFTYTISDGKAYDTATVTITVAAPPNDTDARNDVATTRCEHPVVIHVLANDVDAQGDSQRVTSVTQGGHGTVNINANGTVTYTPSAGFTGTDTFTYTITDTRGATDTATVTVNVTNNAPDAVNDSTMTNKNVPVHFSVLGNDSDPDGDHIAITGHTNPAHGTVVQHADGTFTYTPYSGFVGTDTFTYTISDGKAYDTATVSIQVKDVILPPPPPPPPPPVSPLVIDLDGNGFHTIAAADSHARFDLHADGTADHTAWFSPGDGILARDYNGDGIINDINEVFGNAHMDGYTELRLLEDSTGDGIIDNHDSGWNALKVWVDANSDGVSQASELHGLDSFGIVSIDARGIENHQDLNADSFISHTSTVTLADGSTMDTADIWFRPTENPLVFPDASTASTTVTLTSDGASVANINHLSLHDVLAISVGDDVAALPEFVAEGQSDIGGYVATPAPLPQEDMHNTLPIFG